MRKLRLSKQYLLILFLILSTITYASEDEDFADLQLANLRYDIELWEIIPTSSHKKVKVQLAKSMLFKVLYLATLTFDISKLGGEELETICLITKKSEALLYSTYKEDSELAIRYLNSISTAVDNEIKEAQLELTGKGCFLTEG